MSARKHSPAHDFWHRRVEGQIRHTMGRHPDWFSRVPVGQRRAFVNSLAKRIVGEIVAGYGLAPMPDGVASLCADPVACGDDGSLSPPGRDMLERCVPAEEPSEDGWPSG